MNSSKGNWAVLKHFLSLINKDHTLERKCVITRSAILGQVNFAKD
jgi:hypothetical protein